MLSTKLKEAAGNSADATLYVNDVFSTYLYTGNGSTQTITNGIDLAGKGGLVWVKSRTDVSATPVDHALFDTVRGVSNRLQTSTTAAEFYQAGAYVNAFNVDGFSVGAQSSTGSNTYPYVSWTFRKAAKFFDVVTWTGDGVNGRAIPHNLGIAPGMFFIKRTDNANDWYVYHRSLNSNYWLVLNSSAAQGNAGFAWTTVSSTSFTVPSGIPFNASGGSYVAYLFAHDTDADGIIQCGSFTTDGSGNATVNLGCEPQYIMIKKTNGAEAWYVTDVMRGWTMTGGRGLSPNSSAAEIALGDSTYLWQPTATGFRAANGMLSASSTYIYMAIRRPNKPPTTGAQVFSSVAYTGNGSYPRSITGAGFPPDMTINDARGGVGAIGQVFDKLRGTGKQLQTTNTGSETNQGDDNTFMMDGVIATATGASNESGRPYIDWFFKRAPGFFDEVCYTGTGVNATQAHNLTVAPELIIIKSRSNFVDWVVGNTSLGFAKFLMLNKSDASISSSNMFNNTAPTASVFSIGINSGTNEVNLTYVAYLFTTLAGISKVGSYTGNGSTGQAIACGFSAGARFVLIKRTDDVGDWYTFDSARGLTSGSSPYLLLNSTAAEVTGNNGVYASTGGFTLATSAAGLNASGGTYIFLAVA